jgi:hypothetical protein
MCPPEHFMFDVSPSEAAAMASSIGNSADMSWIQTGAEVLGISKRA